MTASRLRQQVPWLFVISGFLVGTLVGLGLLIGLGGLDPQSLFPGSSGSDAGAGGSIRIDSLAPDFELQELTGERLRLSEFRGKIVVVNFWATWCGPCVIEMPIFERLQQEFAPELVILGVNLEESQDKVRPFINEMQISYPILLDPNGEASRAYQVIQLPNTFFIDRDGVLRIRHIGLLHEEQFRDYLIELRTIE